MELIINTEFKTCTKCNETFPATEEYFYKQLIRTKTKGDYYRLLPHCKSCSKKHSDIWTEANRDKHNESMKKYFKSPKGREVRKHDDSKDRAKKWQQENPNRVKQYSQQHQNHKITKEEWEACKNYFNYECAYCGKMIENHFVKYKGETILGDFHKDHFNHNGLNDLSNCIPSCKSCNSSKGKYEFEYWFKMSGKFSTERKDKIIKWLNEDYKKYINLKGRYLKS